MSRHLTGEALPGVDAAYLAAGEHQALVRWLMDRCGIDELTARDELAALDDEREPPPSPPMEDR